MSRLHRADDPYASDVVAYVTLRIRLSSRPVEKYPPFGTLPAYLPRTIDAAPNGAFCGAVVAGWVLPRRPARPAEPRLDSGRVRAWLASSAGRAGVIR
jgi:hypothetical protein